MRVGIICAGDREVAPFLPMIHDCKMTEKAMLKFYEGKISDVEVVVLFSGVCKVNAAIATQILIDTYHVTRIINAGTAGGMDPKLEIEQNRCAMACQGCGAVFLLFLKKAVTGLSQDSIVKVRPITNFKHGLSPNNCL